MIRVRYYCHLQLTGYGFAAIEYALGLQRHPDVELDLRLLNQIQYTQQSDRLAELASAITRQSDHPDVVLVHTLPRDCPKVLEIARRDSPIAVVVPQVAYTTWEAKQIPAEVANPLYRAFDRILTPSAASAQAFRAPGIPISVVPHGYDPEHVGRVLEHADTYHPGQHDNRFGFYYVGAWNRRKNVEGVVRAFAHAFGGDPAVRLYLLCAGADAAALPMAIAGTGFDRLPVTIERNFLSTTDVWTGHVVGDCFVTASRGEAWGLGSFEAMIAGRHVIAPAGQGSDDYLLATTASLYQSTEQPAAMNVTAELHGNQVAVTASGPTGLTSEQTWWEPDILDLSRVLQSVYDRRERNLRCNPMLDFDAHLRNYTQERVANTLVKELETTLNGH